MQVAALTSYSMAPLKQKISELIRKGIFNIDLYCFCHHDTEHIESVYREHGEQYFIHLDIPLLASQIHKTVQALSSSNKKKIDICGLASYSPDISLPDYHESFTNRREYTLKCLKKTLSLCVELKSLGYSCKTFEIVAGHIITSHSHSESTNPQLQYIDTKVCFNFLNQSLMHLTDYADSIFSNKDDVPVFSMEVEPGIGKLLNNLERIESFLAIISRMPKVGLNLDIGHMLIMSICPEMILKHPIGSKIAHVHISDNAESHFADLMIGKFHNRQIFREWLNQLYIYTRNNSNIFQGLVSIEMEACNDINQVASSKDIVNEIISEILK